MLNPPDIASVHPVSRVMPVLAVENIGSVVQELGDRANQFVKGQEYFAQVLSKVGEKTYHVRLQNVESPSGATKNIVLKMELGNNAKVGESLILRYMQSSPSPTFFLTQSPTNIVGSTIEFSSAASLIANYLKQAEDDGASKRLEATAVVTHQPSNPQAVAQDLKQAVRNSGLFYESHLSDFVQGHQNLAEIKQEPQNQNTAPISTLVTQQLSVLEDKRISWNGEVWPGQKMQWNIEQDQGDKNDSGSWQSNGGVDEYRPITSELTLHLPRLGKVSAKLVLVDGRMRINIQASEQQTLEKMHHQRQALAEAIVKNGQQLDALTMLQKRVEALHE